MVTQISRERSLLLDLARPSPVKVQLLRKMSTRRSIDVSEAHRLASPRLSSEVLRLASPRSSPKPGSPADNAFFLDAATRVHTSVEGVGVANEGVRDPSSDADEAP